MTRVRRRKRGFTLVETMFAVVLTATVMTTTLSVFVIGMMGWFRGEAKIQAESQSHVAVRVMANELRQALSVVADANGLGITYILPLQDGTGTDVVPIAGDGVTRRIQLDGTNLDMLQNGKVVRTICTNVILTDPLSTNGTQPYVIFKPGLGTTTRSVTVEVATKNGGYNAENYSSRNRETIYIRNVPQLNQ